MAASNLTKQVLIFDIQRITSSKSGIEKALDKGAGWILSLQDQEEDFHFLFMIR
jgi:hypothetical protein